MKRALVLGLIGLLVGGEALAADAPTLGNVRIKTIQFTASDGLKVTADLYAPFLSDHPLIILFHRAQWSRGEYKKIGLRLVSLGFNALAVDLRSGRAVNKVYNKTAWLARRKKLATDYLAAYTDMEAALLFAKRQWKHKQVLIWGSSYSASLVFRLAAAHPVAAVIAFSPGEYFQRLGKSATYVRDFAAKLTKVPVLIASARAEQKDWQAIYDAIPCDNKSFYVPQKTPGRHGSSALWPKWPDHQGYWTALESFLAPFRPVPRKK